MKLVKTILLYSFLTVTIFGLLGFIYQQTNKEGVHYQLSPEASAQVTLDTTERVLSLFETVLGVLGLVIPLLIAVFIYLYRKVFAAEQQAFDEAKRATDRVVSLENDLKTQLDDSRELNTQIQNALGRHAKIDEAVENAQQKIEKANKKLRRMIRQSERVEKRLLEIDVRADAKMRHFAMHDPDPWQRKNALNVLIQYSMDEKPYLRWEIASIFTEIVQSEALHWAHSKVIDRLGEMALTDDVISIRLQTQDALRLAGIELDIPDDDDNDDDE